MKRVRGALVALTVGAAMVMAGGWASPATAEPIPQASGSFVTMPYLVSLKLAAARYRVIFIGLTPHVRYLDDDCTIDRVVSQDPGAGAQMSPGADVYLYVHPICNGPQP